MLAIARRERHGPATIVSLITNAEERAFLQNELNFLIPALRSSRADGCTKKQANNLRSWIELYSDRLEQLEAKHVR
jgi:hypothetical protein